MFSISWTRTRAGLLAGLAALGATALAVPGADARRGGDDRDRLIDRGRGAGARACRVAKRRVGGGSACLRVKLKFGEDDGTRYEVDVRRRGVRWEVDLSRRFAVLDVSRDHDRRDDDRDDD
jgi:hypothetical protein